MIIAVSTFRNPHGDAVPETLELIRSSEAEKQSQLKRLRDFQNRNAKQAPAMLKRLQDAVIRNKNVFAVLMDAVRVCSRWQITHALFEAGGQYRRSMQWAGGGSCRSRRCRRNRGPSHAATALRLNKFAVKMPRCMAQYR
jgi:hypothetical protein